MMLPRPQDAIHKTHLYRLLMGLIDDRMLSRALYFKGGTCAVLAGWLDRFSLDVDFDLRPESDRMVVTKRLQQLYSDLGFAVKESRGLFFVLGYPVGPGQRRSIKVSVMTEVMRSNLYAPLYLTDIRRYALCQTRDTMVANKMAAPMDRFERYGTVAGRDIYDIHYFLSHGFGFRKEVIRERRGVSATEYIAQLVDFINERVTDRVLAEDLNFLLPSIRFATIRKTLKEETLILLREAGM